MTTYPSLFLASQSKMLSGDVFDTLGQFHPDGFGAGRYLVRTLQEWRDDPFAELASDWTPTEFRREELYLANGLVARLICDFSPEHQKVAGFGYNLVGDVKYGSGANYRMVTENDVVKQADGGYDQYFSPISLPQTVSGNYTSTGQNADYGRLYFDFERATWQRPLRLGEIRVWFCSDENMHILYGRNPNDEHDGDTYFKPYNVNVNAGGDIPPGFK